MPALLLEVGTGRLYETLTEALGQMGERVASAEGPVTDVVLSIHDDRAVLPNAVLTHPPGSDRLVIRGNGSASVSTLAASPNVRVRLAPTANVAFEDIRFELSGVSVRSLFLQEWGASVLRFRNCVAGLPSAASVPDLLGEPDPALEDAVAFARLTGPRDALVADGLRVGAGFVVGVEADGAPGDLSSSPTVDIRGGGFRDLEIGVRLTNISHSRIREAIFRDCGTGLWLALEPGAPPGGLHHFADNRFQDCGRGAVVQDQSGREAVAGSAPADERPLEGGDGFSPVARTRRRRVQFVRNEFRAPDRSAYPDALGQGAQSEDAWGVVTGESLGLRAEFDPHGALSSSRWPPQLLLQANVFHLLDHGALLVVGDSGQAVVDRNTFVANSIRSVGVQSVADSRSRDLGLAVTGNLFQSVEGRPWLFTLEQEAPPAAVPPRYLFGGVEIRHRRAASSMRQRMWIAANVFADFGPQHPRLYSPGGLQVVGGGGGGGGAAVTPSDVWDSFVTNGPAGVHRWRNLNWNDLDAAVVLRLPRLRLVQGDALLMVEFDYHASLGTAGAPEHASPRSGANVDYDYLRGRDVESSPPPRGYYGEEMSFHPLAAYTVGACRERRPWQSWPLYAWGGTIPARRELVDAWTWGRVYLHRREPADGDATDELLESFGSGDGNVIPDHLAQAATNDLGLVVPIPVLAFPGDVGEWPGDFHDDSIIDVGWTEDGPVAARIRVEIEGELLELPIRRGPEVDSFEGGEWSEAFVAYWLGRVARFVRLVTALDSDDRVAGWMVGDELLGKVPLGGQQSLLELLARARETIAAADPLRRPMYSGLASNVDRPHAGGLRTTVGQSYVALDRQTRWATQPSWSGGRLAGRFLAHGGAHYRGSLLADNRFPDYLCMAVDGGGSLTSRPSDVCEDDFGILASFPLAETGDLRLTTAHVQSSWHFNRSIGDPDPKDAVDLSQLDDLHLTNRSYARHHGRVLRDTLELAQVVADESLTRTPQTGHTFFNPLVFLNDEFIHSAPDSLGPYRHDFWAGVANAGGVWLYNLSYLDELSPDAKRNRWASMAAREGLELIKGTNPAGAGLRQTLANGQRWQVQQEGDAPPPWMASEWRLEQVVFGGTDFGPGAGRTPGAGGPLAPLDRGYLQVGVTALRLGGVTWLLVVNSSAFERQLRFSFVGPSTAATGGGSASDANGQTQIRVDALDAVVVRVGA